MCGPQVVSYTFFTRVRSGWEKFRGLLPLLTTKAISLKVKGELYAACVRSVMLYGSETWPIKVEESQRLHHNEMSMIQWMCGVAMRDRYPCEELRAWVGIKPIVDVMRQRRLRWFGQIERRDANSWLKKVQNLAVDGHNGRGRPRKTWEHVIMEDLRVKGLRQEVAQNRGDLPLHEQSNPCLHGIIMDLKTMMMMMMMMMICSSLLSD